MKNQNVPQARQAEIISRASRAGSTASTLLGAIRYLLENHRAVQPDPLEDGTFRRNRPALRKNNCPARLADPEAKRARDDAKFRAGWLRKLRAEELRLLNPPVRTITEITAACLSRSARSSRLVEIARLKNVAGLKPKLVAVPKITAGITVCSFNAALARKHGAEINMRGADAKLIASRWAHGDHCAGETEWKNGNPIGYTRATHDNHVRSLALIRADDARTVDYALHDTFVVVTLPEGYVWGSDANGLRALHGPDDYHPTAAELLGKNAAAKIVAAIDERVATRKRMAAEREAEAAEVAGVFVCVADSRRAGNCVAGTISFAQRHGLNPSRHYSAPELLALANGDTGRVRLAIKAACIRDRQEREQGFALLTEHAV